MSYKIFSSDQRRCLSCIFTPFFLYSYLLACVKGESDKIHSQLCCSVVSYFSFQVHMAVSCMFSYQKHEYLCKFLSWIIYLQEFMKKAILNCTFYIGKSTSSCFIDLGCNLGQEIFDSQSCLTYVWDLASYALQWNVTPRLILVITGLT